MKILRINDFPAEGGGGGGAELTIAATVRLMKSRGVDEHFFSNEDLPERTRRRTAFSYLSNHAARVALWQKLKALQPDVVHLHNFYHYLSPAILGVLATYRRRHPLKIVATAHDLHLACPNSGGNIFGVDGKSWQTADFSRLRSLRYIAFQRWDHRGAAYSLLKAAQHLHYRLYRRHRVIDLLICPSRFVQDVMQRTGLKTIVVPPPIEVSLEVPSKPRGRLRLIIAGRLEPEKGVAEFLQSLPPDFDADITIVGEGSELDRCRVCVNQRGRAQGVTFTGRLPHDQTLQLIGQHHVLAQPSLCLESYGRTVIEALAAGTNMLVTDRGGLREIVEDSGTGFVYSPADAQSLHRGLAEIQRRHAAGSLNAFDVREFLESRSEHSYVERLLSVYDFAGALAVGSRREMVA